jgi:hypothetical protein
MKRESSRDPASVVELTDFTLRRAAQNRVPFPIDEEEVAMPVERRTFERFEAGREHGHLTDSCHGCMLLLYDW